MKEGWKKFSQQVKDGFDKFGKDTKKFFDNFGDKIKKESDKAVENMQLQKKINLESICQRHNSNIPPFALAASQSIIKHIDVEGMFQTHKFKLEYQKLWKTLKTTGCVEKINFVDPVILSQLFLKFYKSIDQQLFDEVAPKLKSIGQDVDKAAEALKSLSLNYQYNSIFILRFMKIIANKEKKFDLKALAGIFQPSFSQKINFKDEDVIAAFEFLVITSDKIEKALGIDCSQFIQPLESE